MILLSAYIPINAEKVSTSYYQLLQLQTIAYSKQFKRETSEQKVKLT